MNNPCELCRAKFGKYITDECDKDCEFGRILKQNDILKNRCSALTGGVLCYACPYECKNRTVGFQDAEALKQLMPEGGDDGTSENDTERSNSGN